MHEIGIAQAIVDVVEEEARKADATRVLVVRLALGELSGVVEEQLVTCFPFVTKGTRLEGATLEVERVTGEGFCRRCQASFPLPRLLDPCPRCGEYTSDIRAGQELRVSSLEVD